MTKNTNRAILYCGLCFLLAGAATFVVFGTVEYHFSEIAHVTLGTGAVTVDVAKAAQFAKDNGVALPGTDAQSVLYWPYWEGVHARSLFLQRLFLGAAAVMLAAYAARVVLSRKPAGRASGKS